ncbi:hypothetical protein LCGC14_1364600 [marine sediment metagenome]|uniref:Uncharacterized protein n=1 Tax=marine sediment metagenome TaxID=412755 RepID=A0A0F9K757_9ZZZZ
MACMPKRVGPLRLTFKLSTSLQTKAFYPIGVMFLWIGCRILGIGLGAIKMKMEP